MEVVQLVDPTTRFDSERAWATRYPAEPIPEVPSKLITSPALTSGPDRPLSRVKLMKSSLPLLVSRRALLLVNDLGLDRRRRIREAPVR